MAIGMVKAFSSKTMAINILANLIKEEKLMDSIKLRPEILGPKSRISNSMEKDSINGKTASFILASLRIISLGETLNFIIPMDRLLLEYGKMGIISW